MNTDIKNTLTLDLCVSCGVCKAVCPANAISMYFARGQFLPIVDEEKCTHCGLCLQVCPGYDIYPEELRDKGLDNFIKGDVLACYTAHTKDFIIRKNSASGGLISGLIVNLIKDKKYDYAFVLKFDRFEGSEAKLEAICDIEKIMYASKSKYLPVSVENIIKTLKEKNRKKYIIVGTPCQFSGDKEIY